MFMDTRAQAKRLLGSFERTERQGMLKTLGCALLALAVVFLPGILGSEIFATLPPGAMASLGIMVFAAALWVTEAMPAFAVALLVIGLQIAILGNPGGVWAPEGDTKAWTTFVEPWSSPTMWLFLGGFVLAHGCSKTQLDKWLAGMVLGRFATSPAKLVASVMAITFLFSMFMSNTATAAMMIAVTAPVLAGLPKESRLAKGLVLAVAAGANLGGIGTIIGTPPNAIAAGQLQGKIDFMKWMAIALPPALLLAAAVYLLIWRIYLRGGGEKPAINLDSSLEGDARQKRHRITVMIVFAVTVAMWMGESLTGIPSPVVSFIPIVALAVSGVIGARDMRVLPWDVLLLLAGGLSLGVGVEVTGLAQWFASLVPGNLGILSIAAVFSLLGLFLSNLMSNTAAAALLIPLASSLAGDADPSLIIISIAISCSAAMALPISTPPNAIAHSTERLSSGDFLLPGLLAAAGMALVLPWLAFALR
ncbi:DASS family sodium-coupled anion symporter [Akkermansiaceae bacterium]|nr:DASS family sodium-coupled anion symporter [Akkermansiaceae bacterium]